MIPTYDLKFDKYEITDDPHKYYKELFKEMLHYSEEDDTVCLYLSITDNEEEEYKYYLIREKMDHEKNPKETEFIAFCEGLSSMYDKLSQFMTVLSIDRLSLLLPSITYLEDEEHGKEPYVKFRDRRVILYPKYVKNEDVIDFCKHKNINVDLQNFKIMIPKEKRIALYNLVKDDSYFSNIFYNAFKSDIEEEDRFNRLNKPIPKLTKQRVNESFVSFIDNRYFRYKFIKATENIMVEKYFKQLMENEEGKVKIVLANLKNKVNCISFKGDGNNTSIEIDELNAILKYLFNDKAYKVIEIKQDTSSKRVILTALVPYFFDIDQY